MNDAQPPTPDAAFEAELGRFVPAPPSPALRVQVGAALASSGEVAASPRHYRFFLSMVSMGAAAAVVIVVLHTQELFEARTPSAPPPALLTIDPTESLHTFSALASGSDLFDPRATPRQ